MRPLILPLLAALSLTGFVGWTGPASAAGPAEGSGPAPSGSAPFTRSSDTDTGPANSVLATFFVAVGDGTYVCILHPEWNTLSTPAPP